LRGEWGGEEGLNNIKKASIRGKQSFIGLEGIRDKIQKAKPKRTTRNKKKRKRNKNSSKNNKTKEKTKSPNTL